MRASSFMMLPQKATFCVFMTIKLTKCKYKNCIFVEIKDLTYSMNAANSSYGGRYRMGSDVFHANKIDKKTLNVQLTQ